MRLRTIILLFLGVIASAVPLSLLLSFRASAAMQSSNYSIPSDSVNFGGGNSSSANYAQESTAGEIATGPSSSSNYTLQAGFQQLSASSISISSAPNVTLPNLGGISGGTSVASSTWNVLTDDPAGYQLTASAATSPALKGPGGAAFADYLPGGASPDFSFSVPSGKSLFGFSAEGPDILSRWKDNGSACGTGSSDTSLACWDGFSTVPAIVAAGVGSNEPNGASTTIEYQAGVGTNKIQDAGTYTATITVTAVAL